MNFCLFLGKKNASNVQNSLTAFPKSSFVPIGRFQVQLHRALHLFPWWKVIEKMITSFFLTECFCVWETGTEVKLWHKRTCRHTRVDRGTLAGAGGPWGCEQPRSTPGECYSLGLLTGFSFHACLPWEHQLGTSAGIQRPAVPLSGWCLSVCLLCSCVWVWNCNNFKLILEPYKEQC